jgi:AcrR family transcriptional regulator
MKQKTATLGRASPGRPREFDRHEALQTAVKLFCQHGYEGVSIADLTHAMDISPPSLYAAFGGKEALYREALESYLQHKSQWHIENAGSVRDQVAALLRDTVRAATEPGYPAGCMVVAGMLNCAAENQSLASTLSDLRNAQCKGFAEHLREGLARGELAEDTDIEALGRYLTALVQGIAIQAKDGATPAELFALVDIAMAHWPASPICGKRARIEA